MDKTYKDRLAYRRSLLAQHHDTIVAVNTANDNVNSNDSKNNKASSRVHDAVSELYTFLMGTYLPGRFPTMFKLHRTQFATGPAVMIENVVTGEVWPVQLGGGAAEQEAEKRTLSTIRALETILKTIDEDFLILLPELDGQGDENKEERGEDKTISTPSTAASTTKTTKDGATQNYILEAFVTCYPAGFNPRKKLGKRLAAIHAPVPGYPEKLEKSMDRCFEKLEVGQYVKRVNWSITTDVEPFSPFANNVHGSEGEKLVAIKPEELNVEKVCFTHTYIHTYIHTYMHAYILYTYLSLSRSPPPKKEKH
jgi:hypothetical protein